MYKQFPELKELVISNRTRWSFVISTYYHAKGYRVTRVPETDYNFAIKRLETQEQNLSATKREKASSLINSLD